MLNDFISNLVDNLANLNVFLGVTLGCFLLFNKSAINRANIYFGLMLLGISTYTLPYSLNLLGILEYVPHIIHIHLAFSFLLGPMIFLYVKSCTRKEFRLRTKDLLHFIPWLIYMISKASIFLNSGAEKIAQFELFLENRTLIEEEWLIGLKFIHAIIYYILAVRLIFIYKNHLANNASNIDVSFHRWLLVFCLMLSLPIVGMIFSVFIGIEGHFYFLFTLGNSFFLLSVYIAVLTKPKLFHALPNQIVIQKPEEEKKRRYENSNLKEELKIKYLKKLQTYLENEESFKNPELTLSKLSEDVNIPSHYVSQVINEKLKVNFLDFINGYRIKAAKNILLDDKFDHYTVTAIAYEAGFNSRSTFYSAFKKMTGKTPSAYRKEMLVA